MDATDPVTTGSFASIYRYGFVRIAAAVPRVRIAEPLHNAEHTLGLAARASDEHAALVAFPELGLSGYSIEDLLHQQALLGTVLEALKQLVAASRDLFGVLVVGAPLQAQGGLFNTAVVIH